MTILISSPVIGRTYKNKAFLSNATNHTFVDSSQLYIPTIYKLYASIIFKILSLKYAYRSRTFRYRIVRGTGLFDLLLSLKHCSVDIKVFILFLLKCISLIILVPFALLPRKALSYCNGFIRLDKFNREFLCSNSMLVFPFTAFEVEQLFLPGICRRHNIELVYVTDNWDNLSSKTVILDQPDRIYVWGKQSVDHALNIQGFNNDIVEVGSSPRLQIYRGINAPNNEKKTIGFMGAFMYFDEVRAINEICEQLPKDWTVLYRPHPWAMKRQEIDVRKLSAQVKVDLDANGNVDTSIEATKGFFEQVDVTVGGLTTMLLESLLAKRPCIALMHNDHILNFYSPACAYRYYLHFEHIHKLPLFKLVDKISNFEKAFNDLRSMTVASSGEYWMNYHVDVSKPVTLPRIIGDSNVLSEQA